MNRETVGRLFVWGVLLTVFVGLPALLRRSRLRAFRRNQLGACGRCGTELTEGPAGYMEGFRVCARCARVERRNTIVALSFLGALAALSIVVAALGAVDDARQGQFGPWWVYAVVLSSGLVLAGLGVFAWRATNAANRRAATKDASAARISDLGDEYQP